nr:uncharacterized mitochondrial protein AtMg00810-like [Tanacetum cinerariifolium]
MEILLESASNKLLVGDVGDSVWIELVTLDINLDGKPIDTEKHLLKDPNGEDVDVHTYRYLKGKPHLGLWYPKDSPFNLVAYSDSDYAGASLDKKSTTGGCQFLGCRLISWQCKKQTVVATSSTEAEYVAAASCYAQVLWIQNQLLDYGQFWTFVSIKKTNNIVRLQALIDRNKVIITEVSIRQAIRLDNADSVDCLPNEDIFAELARMGYEKPVDTPLFDGMFVPQQAQDVEVAAEDEDAANEEDASKQGGEIAELDANEDVTLETVDDTDEAEPAEVEEVIEVVIVAKLMTEVVTTAATTITAAQVPKASAPRRRRGVVIQDPKEIATASVIVHSEVKSKDKGKGILFKEPKPLKRQAQIEQDDAFARELEAELNANINWNDVVDQVKRKENQDNTVMRYQALKRKPVTEAQARINMMLYLKNKAGFKMDFFRGMTYTDIRPIFEKH